MSLPYEHEPVLLREVVKALGVRRGGKYIDATAGMGGHTREILKRGGQVLGIDSDPEAIKILKSSVREFLTKTKNEASPPVPRTGYSKAQNKKLVLVRGNFKNLKQIAQNCGFKNVAGILFDLGLSSWQIEKSGRGFSYLRDEPLDMRVDPRLKMTAAEIINHSSKEELSKIFSKFGEEVTSISIADTLIDARPIRTTRELVEAIGEDRHKLARVFQALRIVVNNELDNLKEALPQAIELLEKKGRLVVISFHSLEDRIIKFGLKVKILKIITKKMIRPSKEELMRNPRSRSARMRIAERI